MKLVSLLCAISLPCSSVVLAQGASVRVAVGEDVRFRAMLDTSAAVSSAIQCYGRISQLRRDTVVVRQTAGCDVRGPDLPQIRDFQVERNKGSRAFHVVAGVGLGTLVGAVAGIAISGDGCRVSGCDPGFSSLEAGLQGVVIGGAIGGVIGYFLPSGRYWLPVSGPVRLEPR